MDGAIIWDEAYAEHDTGAHPEGSDRISTIVGYLETSDLWQQLRVIDPAPATVDDILRVHTPAYVDMIRRAAEGGGRWIDGDTHVSARSYDIALLSAGGTLEATRHWDESLAPFALVRPPGHHALPDRGMGFCLFNNVAIAAVRLLDRGLERVAILDWDVHHGNGTQAVFIAEPRVLFVSLHQWPLYPGSGWVTEVGTGAGAGFTVNVPLPSGSRDGDYAHAFAALVEPIVEQFAPQAILVSAGQDPHADDPLASMVLTEHGFAHMALRALELAQSHAEGRLALTLEGGYDRVATAHSVEAILRAIVTEEAPAVSGASARGEAAVAQVIAAQRAYWTL